MDFDLDKYPDLELPGPEPAPEDEYAPNGGPNLDAVDFSSVKFPCPLCGGPTVRRIAKKHPHWHGTPFYGCRSYPDCSSITSVNGCPVMPPNDELKRKNFAALREAADLRERFRNGFRDDGSFIPL